jgi:GNAT superfamily N-acetyltransferase
LPVQDIQVVRIEQLPIEDLQPLLEESRAQGFTFVDRLATEYLDGTNRFAGPTEALFGIYCDRRLVAIGGLNRDPYLQQAATGRVRHVYVLAAWRGQGIGRRLVGRIIAEARPHYRLLTLRTVSEQADRFYRAIGFQTEPEIPNATHHLVLQE